MNRIKFQRFNGDQAPRIRERVEDIYTQSYVNAISSGDPFDSPSAFMHRFDSYVKADGFDLVVAYQDRLPVGQTWGWPLKENSAWWAGLESIPDPDFTHENGQRTFALSEIMVRKEFQGQGIAHALHDHLLKSRHESRATLLVEPENEEARRAYIHWGWQVVSTLRPAWDHAPKFDVLIRQLPL